MNAEATAPIESHSPSGPPPDSEPFVSVIVPVRDNAAGVRAVLRCLAAQTLAGERFEIVIGDDGSRPGSLAGIATSDGRVRLTSGPPQTSYAARNRAARAARGSVLAFCDSDCRPDPNWLAAGLASLQIADIAAGEVTFVAPPRPTVWSMLTADMYLDQQRNVWRSRGVTANLFIKRRVFELCGGFDETMPSGGDYDFVQRAVTRGASLRYAPQAVVLHPTIDHRRGFLRKVWMTNWWAAARRARDKDRPDLSGFLIFIPFLGLALARRRALQPVLHLCRPRLEAADMRVNGSQELLALAVLYVGVASVAGLARVRGWTHGRRLRLKLNAEREPAVAQP